MAQAIPNDYGAVTPYIVVKGASRLIDFLKAAFGAEERGRFPNPDGTLAHAEVTIGGRVIQMFDAKPGWPDTPSFITLYVEDAEAIRDAAVAAGATEITPLDDNAWGDRMCRVRDPFGNIWWIQTHRRDVSEAEMERLMGEPKYQANLKTAAETFDAEMRQRAR
jgi:PhnB protein